MYEAFDTVQSLMQTNKRHTLWYKAKLFQFINDSNFSKFNLRQASQKNQYVGLIKNQKQPQDWLNDYTDCVIQQGHKNLYIKC